MKTLLLCALSLISLSVFAQQSDTLYSYSHIGGKEIKKEKAVNIYKIYKLDSAIWVRTTSNHNLIPLKRETFSDEKLTILNGSYVEYEEGKVKLKGSYNNGKKTGTWIVYDKDGKVEQSIVFPDN
ncbi:hypothetical protein [Pedobacter sp.]|uniref:hypothetical protein n=1 Tax=Pedobacter sp. TaxID=1411316 RepID=UPI003BAA157B